jgi:hypothetical protein
MGVNEKPDSWGNGGSGMADDRRLERSEDTGGEPELLGRREFLLGLRKWSAAVIGGVALGAVLAQHEAAAGAWVNGRGGWVNGVAWANRGGAWVNGGGAWVNGFGPGGGAWVNGHGGGGGAWVNGRGYGGGAWVNR